jgi:hypothetical protein
MPRMSATALLLVLVAAALHAWWNIALKRIGGGDHVMLLVTLGVLVLWAPAGLVVAWQMLPGWRGAR